MTGESWVAAIVLGWAGFVTVYPLILSYISALRHQLNADSHALIRGELDELRDRVRALESRRYPE